MHKKIIIVRPGVRPNVPSEMAEGDPRLMIYQCTTNYNKNSNNVNVWIYNIIYNQFILHHTNSL